MDKKTILSVLIKTGKTTEAILDLVIGNRGRFYHSARRKVLYPTAGKINQNNLLLAEEKNRFYVLLSQLKKQGFIEKKNKSDKDHWFITDLGRKKLIRLKKHSIMPATFYKKEKDDGLNLVIFDIPEIYKSKRNWLRFSLLNLDFKMLQKSVWAGTNKLPEDFLHDLRDLNLTNFIHIFRVSKKGTIS